LTVDVPLRRCAGLCEFAELVGGAGVALGWRAQIMMGSCRG
jgi:hypothetical protein